MVLPLNACSRNGGESPRKPAGIRIASSRERSRLSRELHSQLIDWHYAIVLGNVNAPSTLEEYREKLGMREETFRRAMVVAKVYVDEITDATVHQAFGALRQASLAIWLSLPDEVIPHINKQSYGDVITRIQWQPLDETYEAATAGLRKLLNPAVLDRLTPSE